MSPIRREPRTGRASIARRPAADPQTAGSQTADPQPAGPPAARPERSPGRRAATAAGLGLLMLALSGCTSNQFTRLGWPVPVTNQGKVMLSLWQGSWIAAFAVGALVWGLIIWACIFHRKRSDDLPPQVRYNLPIEITYTVVPFIMIAVLFYFTARDENYVNAVSSRPDVRVNVTGFQWSWQFAYPQYKVPGSAAGDVTVTGRPYPGPLPVLVIPEHETVKFTLNTLDVVHSFWIPEFEFKRDLIPNHVNTFQVTPTKTGTYLGHCTELCGLYHAYMLFRVRIVTPQQFHQFIVAKQAQQKAGGAQ